jgi:hypothetical protein
VAFEIAEELDLVTSVYGCIVCAQMDNFLPAVIAERCVEEEGAVNALVGCSVDWGEVPRGLERMWGVTGKGLMGGGPYRLWWLRMRCERRSRG